MAAKTGVESTSIDYQKNIDKWRLNRLVETADILHDKEWKEFLFYPQKWDRSDLGLQRQHDFINGASMFPALKRTLDGSLGVIFRKPANIELVPQLQYLEDNSDGAGKTLEQLIHDVTAENVLQGYGGMLTDFAVNDELLSRADDVQRGNFATIHLYKAEHIRNVYTIRVGSAVVVQQIVLQENYQERVNQFDVENKVQYRVLMIDEDGLYKQQVYRLDEDNKSSELVEEHEPRNAQGQRLDYIPFSFFGSESNDFHVDNSPLHGIAMMNSKHLEYSAMRNESIRQLAPTLFAFPGENFDYEDFQDQNPSGITMGGYNAYMLGAGGSATVIQAASNDAAQEEMKHLEEMMLQAGALLITPVTSNVSTETVIIQRSSETSVLALAVKNVEQAIAQQLEYVADFMGAPDGSTLELNKEFFNLPMNAQDRAQWASDVMSGFVTPQEYREALNKAGILPDMALEEEIQPIMFDEEPLPEDDEIIEDGDE
jgi:hypothetical protein